MDRKKKAIIGIVVCWAICVIGLVGFLIFKNQKHEEQEQVREDLVRDMVNQINEDKQETFVVKADDLVVEGEEEDQYEESVTTEPAETDDVADNDYTGGSNDYNLETYGTLSIPSIDCELPIWEGAGKVELRYGVGHIPITADAGQVGNFVILGHRMKRYGSIFNRLGEVQIGDIIKVSSEDCIYEYVVDEIETISPSELSAYIGVSEEGCRITLVTCTPTGVGSHRLLVIGHLK